MAWERASLHTCAYWSNTMAAVRTDIGSSPWLLEEVRRFDPNVPLEAAWLPPKSWYTDARFYDLECGTVFKQNWLIAARSDQFKKPGDFVAGSVAGEPYVVVRGEDNKLRAFFNVCRHHAAVVAVGTGCTESLVCPYHGW